MNPSMVMSGADWLQLLLHFLALSLLAVGGAISTAPDMHRFLVNERHWISDPQFSSSIAIAQAAPGPNVLFVALMGWNVGLNAGGGASGGARAYTLALLGAAISMTGIMVPSGLLTYGATRWAHRNRDLGGVRAFKAGMAPVVVGLMLSTGWLLATTQHSPDGYTSRDWRLWLLTAVTTLIVWRTRIHLLWLIGAGALAGVLGWL